MVTNRTATIIRATPEVLTGTGIRKAYDMWLGVKGEQELPPVSAVNPFRIPKSILADCSIISIEDGPKRYWVRLVGTRVTRAAGMDLTHSWGDDVEGGEDVRAALALCIELRWPVILQSPTAWAVHDFKTVNSLLMPYAAEDGTVRRILSFLEFN